MYFWIRVAEGGEMNLHSDRTALTVIVNSGVVTTGSDGLVTILTLNLVGSSSLMTEIRIELMLHFRGFLLKTMVLLVSGPHSPLTWTSAVALKGQFALVET